jgi:peptidoglycan/LPS O-acetylase OafA/YrhL
VDSTPAGRPQPLGTGAAYAALFLLGAAEGLIGCFQFSRSAGPVPVAALAFCLLIFATCLLAGWGMGTPLGGLVVALGWFAMSVVLTMPTRGGSVIVSNSAAGKWFLYGGAVCAGAGLAVTFRWRTRRPARARGRAPGAGS